MHIKTPCSQSTDVEFLTSPVVFCLYIFCKYFKALSFHHCWGHYGVFGSYYIKLRSKFSPIPLHLEISIGGGGGGDGQKENETWAKQPCHKGALFTHRHGWLRRAFPAGDQCSRGQFHTAKQMKLKSENHFQTECTDKTTSFVPMEPLPIISTKHTFNVALENIPHIITFALLYTCNPQNPKQNTACPKERYHVPVANGKLITSVFF